MIEATWRELCHKSPVSSILRAVFTPIIMKEKISFFIVRVEMDIDEKIFIYSQGILFNIITHLGAFMSKRSNDKLETKDTETHYKSVVTIPIEKIAKRFIVPHDTYWVCLDDLNGLETGNYLSMFFLALGTTLFGLWLTSSNDAVRVSYGFLCLINLASSGILHIILVRRKVRKWKREAIRIGDVK